jgi:hypothetical protein
MRDLPPHARAEVQRALDDYDRARVEHVHVSVRYALDMRAGEQIENAP